jgi:hypothetical protein
MIRARLFFFVSFILEKILTFLGTFLKENHPVQIKYSFSQVVYSLGIFCELEPNLNPTSLYTVLLQ